MKYAYRARDRAGRIIKGTMEAESLNLVIESLQRQDYIILGIKEEANRKTAPKKALNLRLFQTVKVNDLALFTRQLSTMVGAGLPIIRSFQILEEQTTNSVLRKMASQIRENLEGGLALNEILSRYPKTFSPMYVSMVRAGEISGALDTVLDRLADTLERDWEINSKVKSASVYPIMVMSIAILVVIFILMFVMPTFVESYASTDVELPAFTMFFLNISYFLKEHFVRLVLSAILLAIGLKAWGHTSKGRLFLDSLYLKIPIVGKAINRVAVSRFTRILGTLIKSGVPILQALEVLQGVVGNRVIGDAIGHARDSIREGQSIAAPLAATKVFEPMVPQMIAIGEETGTLDHMLERMSAYYDNEVTLTVDAILKSLEPILIIFISAIIGMIVVATYLPIFNLMGTMY